MLPDLMKGAKLLIHKAEKQKIYPPARQSGRKHYKKGRGIYSILDIQKGQVYSIKNFFSVENQFPH